MMNIVRYAKSAVSSGFRGIERLSLLLALLILGTAPVALAQAIPAAEASPISTGFALPLTAGTLQYAVSASESLVWGYYGGSSAAAYTNLNGDVAYISSSTRDPFSMVLTAGRSWATSNGPSYSYANLGLSQVINIGRWNGVLSDNVSYLPGTPTTGLSGIPGLGDLGVPPIQVGVNTGQGILTDYSNRISNTSSASIQRRITGKTSIYGSGYYSLIHFLDNSFSSLGLDNTSASGGGGVNHEFSRRTSMGGNYIYSTYDYGVLYPGFSSQTASLSYTHQYSRKLSLSGAAGPQWTTIQTPGSKATLSLFVNASASYTGHLSNSMLAYIRSTNSGYGVAGGTLSDSVSLATSRTFARVWNGSLMAAFSRSVSLPGQNFNQFNFHTTVAGGQVSRALARSLSIYGSLTFQNQSGGTAVGTVGNAFNGSSETLGFGITYSPVSRHFGRP